MADAGSTIKTPFGAQKKKTVYMVGGIVVILGAVMYYRSKKSAAANAANSAAASTTMASQIDPATGYPYGSAQDAAAMQASSNYVNPTGYGGGASTASPAPQAGGGFTSNGQWAQSAEAYLGNTVGLPMADVSAAIGKYLTGQPADVTQQSYITQAIAAEGLPPVGGASGYPPSINSAPVVSTAPAVTPVTTAPVSSPASLFPPGDYNLNHAIYRVRNGTRYHISPATYKVLQQRGQIHPVTVTAGNAAAFMLLPQGPDI